MARVGHALSDPTRTQVMLVLHEGPSYPADLAERIQVSRQSLSNHLACLRGCGLVVAEPEGRWIPPAAGPTRRATADDRPVDRAAVAAACHVVAWHVFALEAQYLEARCLGAQC